MYRLFIAICISIFPSFLLAQIDSFDIAGYARPDLRRETASFVPSFYIGDNYKEFHDDAKENTFSLNFGGTYNKSLFVNSANEQIGLNINYRLFTYYTKRGGERLRDDDFINFFDLRPSFNIDKRHTIFKNEKNNFFEYQILGSINIDILQAKQVSLKKISRQLLNGSFAFPVFLGKGRIELVNDYWHSATIFEMLELQNLMRKDVNDLDILDFAYEISRIRNIRNTDGRLQGIDAYEKLCTYLIGNDLVNSDDYRFFAHLRDAWSFEAFINRFNGKKWKIGIVPQFRSNAVSDGNFFIGTGNTEVNSLVDSDYNYSFGFSYSPYLLEFSTPFIRDGTFIGSFSTTNAHWLTGGLSLSVSYENRKSVSMDWQKDFFINMQLGPKWSYFISGNPAIDRDNLEKLTGNLLTTYRIWYIPNARTFYSINFDLMYEFDYNYGLLDNSLANDEYSGRLIANLRWNYTRYISPQFSWHLNTVLNYGRRQNYSDRASASFGIFGGVNYRFY